MKSRRVSIDRKPVKSHAIAAIGHDPKSNTLHVEFQSGHVYEYSDVTAEEHQAFVNAPSIGAHFQTHLRGRAAQRI